MAIAAVGVFQAELGPLMASRGRARLPARRAQDAAAAGTAPGHSLHCPILYLRRSGKHAASAWYCHLERFSSITVIVTKSPGLLPLQPLSAGAGVLSSCQKRIPDAVDQNKTACEKLVYTLRQTHSFSGNCIYRGKRNNRINRQITLPPSLLLTQLSISFVLSPQPLCG